MLVLLMTVVSGANPSNGVLKGRVVDFGEHAPISRAFILVHAHGSESDGVRVAIDNSGYFSAELPSNFYELFISSQGFFPACEQVKVEPGKTVMYNAVLRMSTLVNSPD